MHCFLFIYQVSAYLVNTLPKNGYLLLDDENLANNHATIANDIIECFSDARLVIKH